MLGEVKWSYTDRTKIFEAVWDAVKLCLAADTEGATRCWLITGAPLAQWREAEARRLFEAGTVPFSELWNEPLVPPGSNGGTYVGEDLLLGGRGNRFTRTPSAFVVRPVASKRLVRSSDDWLIKAVALTAAGEWIEDFAEPPRFPRRITQQWLAATVPAMGHEEFSELLCWLRLKRWTESEITNRVRPLRLESSQPD